MRGRDHRAAIPVKAACVAFLVGVAAGAAADAPLRPPSEEMRWSPNRRFAAVSDPKRDAVTVYRVENGQRTELWSVKPWQRSFDVADDGEHLVACYSGLNLLPVDYRPDETMLQFYARGREVRKWSLQELVPDRGKLRRTASHYHWGMCKGFDAISAYQVETVDRGALRFDIGTGALLERK
jgi:hypothetical protein